MKVSVATQPLGALFSAGASGLVELAPGLKVPQRMEGTIEGEDLPFDIDLVVVLDKGRFVCEELACRRKPDGLPVETELVRQLPVARLVREVATSYLFHVEELDKGGFHVSPYNWHGLRESALEHGPTEVVIEGVARLYRFAFACGMPPTKTIVEEIGIPRSTAVRWISMARQRGLLGPARARRAGVGER